MIKEKGASSDSGTGAESKILTVSNYHLEDDERFPVSFSALPIQWGEAENSDAIEGQVFLHGSEDDQMQIMVPVTAWRYDLSSAKPELSLLSSKDKTWIKLQKPRNSFFDTIRTVLVTVHFLHRVKKNPNISSKSVWDKLFKVKELSSYKPKPSQKDLLEHMSLIAEAAKRDVSLAKSKMLLAVLKEKLGNKKLSDEEVKDLIQPAFVNETKEESKDEDGLSVCALCDDGGDVVNCEGPCMRSFHVTKEDGRQSSCDSLCLTQKEIEGNFYCKNCEFNQHQCFACGKLGYSGNLKDAEVIKCAYATCEHFYHPHCVAKQPSQVVEHFEEQLQREVAVANSFICQVHYCCVCKEVENPEKTELQFAICRRCPKSYHRKCLPREISFGDTDEDIETRAWDGLLRYNRILIYCLNHELDEELQTPLRDHIKFPEVNKVAPNINATNERMKPATKQKVISNKNSFDLRNSSGKSTAKGSEVTGKLSSEKACSKEHFEKVTPGSNISTKAKETGTPRSLANNKRLISKKSENAGPVKSTPSCVLKSKSCKKTKPNSQANDTVCKVLPVKPIRQLSSSPGSDDVNGRKIGESNGKPTALSYESHSNDGTTKRKVVTQEHGNNGETLSPSDNLLKSADDREDQAPTSGGRKRSSPDGNIGQESQEFKKPKMSKPRKTVLKRKRTKENDTRALGAGSSAKKQNVNEKELEGLPHVEGNQPKSVTASPNVEASSNNGDQHSEPTVDPETTCSDHGVTTTEKSQTESDIRQVALCEAQGPDSGHDHGQPSSTSESSYKMNTPALERYAPCRDDICLGFAPGPNLAYSRLHSAGWLDE